MKKIIWILSLIVATSSWGYAQQDPYNDNNNSDDVYYNDNSNYNQQSDDGMSYQTFYDQLSPYGSWIDYPGYGYVWVPQVDEGFSPYMTSGRWVYTDMGWTWASDYQWGWATFHYGRWFRDPDYGGWMWMPGYDWAPAWVTWGTYDDYYCWMPIGPQGYVNSRYGDRYMHHWNCLPRGHMGDDDIGRYVVSNHVVNHDRNDFERRLNVVNNTHTYNRSVFNAGPRVEDVQRAVGHDVRRVTVSNSSAPGKTEVRGNQINVYRPAINRNAPQQHAIPTKVVRPEEVHNNAPANRSTEPRNNPTPARSEPPQRNNTPAEQPRTAPTRENNNSGWTPPRQNVPQQQERYNPAPQPRSEPSYQRPSGGFVPAERPSYTPARSAPAPSFHAPSGGGGGGHAGGGRH